MFKAVCTLLLFASSLLHGEEIQRVNDGVEVQVRVPLMQNVEKKVFFEEPVAVGVTASFKEHFRLQVIGNNIYIQPLKPTERVFRLSAKGQKTQRSYVLSVVVTKDPKDAEQVTVVWSAPGNEPKPTIVKLPDVTPVQLVRFVSQNLYAPKYAIEPLKGARAIALSLPASMDFIYEGSELHIKPLLAFRAGKWTVTAFEAVNKSVHKPVQIDLMNIYSRVSAYAAVAQHNFVGTTESDNKTVFYVVTEGDFANFLNVGV